MIIKDYIDSINEGLIKTYSGNVVSNDLSNLLIDLSINFNVKFEKEENKIKLTFNFFNAIPVSSLEDLFDLINSSVVNRGGWFPSKMNMVNIHGMEISKRYDMDNLFLNHSNYIKVEIIYESKFDDIIYDVPDKLYHLSISEYKNKIVKFGLIPKSKDKLTSHLDRVYLCKNYEDCNNLINRMKLYYNDEKLFNVYNKQNKKYNKNTIPVIFEIDNSDKFINKLYKDPNYIGGFYMLDNIPPSKIKIV